jgi:hypothetical protein
MRESLSLVDRTLARCLVCGFREVRTDVVIDRGLVLLAECPHCDHRWIRSAEPALAVESAAPRPQLRRAPPPLAGAA